MRPELEYRITITGAAANTISYNANWSHIYITSGVLSLAGAYSFDFSGGTLAEGDSIRIWCDLTNLDLNGHTCTIASVSIPQRILSAGKFYVDVRCYNDKGRGVLVTSVDYAGIIDDAALATDSVTTNKIADNAVTYAKLQDFTARGYILRGGVAGAPEAFKANTSGNLLLGNGTDITSLPMSGDATIDGSGKLTIETGVITEDKLAFTLTSYVETTVTLSSAQILSLNSSPVTLVSAPGSGKYIEVISATAYNNFNTAAFANGADLLELQIGAKVWEFPNSFTEAGSDQVCQGTRVDNAVITTNTALTARTTSADPTLGDGAITIKVIYRINTI